MKTRICYFVGTHGDWGGASRILFNIARKLSRERFSPIVMLSGRGPASAELDSRGIEHYEWRQNDALRGPGRFVSQLVNALRFFRKKQIAVVHLNHTCLGWRPPEVAAARLLGIPVLVHCQLPVAKPSPDLRWANLVLTCSEYLARVSDTGPSPRQVLYDLVDMERFGNGKNIRTELDLAESDVVVSFVGRARRAKGLEMFVAMAKALPGTHVRFLMTGQRIGKPTADSYSPEEIAQLVGQDRRIRFLGFREDIENLYASSDIIVMPSKKDEPCPAVLIEAAACGRPVVATNVGSNAEFVNDGETGFLVERDSLQALTSRVSQLIGDAALRRRMGARASQIAEQRFVREPIAKIQEIYASLAPCTTGRSR